MRSVRVNVAALATAVVASAVWAQAQQITSKDVLAGFANPSRWVTYSGDYSGRRHSPLTQITPANVGSLALQWVFQTGVAGKFEATPLVVDGVMYISGPLNHAWAIDVKTGKQIWHYERQLPSPINACCGLVNRGLAIDGDNVFMATLDAHLVALSRKTGGVVYDVEIADFKSGYAATPAPLLVKDKLIVGIAGGEFGIRGFIDAYEASTGKRAWRFWTVPEPGEPGGDTWPAEAWKRGGGPTWLTGTYDPELNLLYWGTGNPAPDFDGDARPGDNLYTGALVALDADTGRLRWHYQFTPHDTHDWDANQIPVLADLTIAGKPRKVVMVANRNGFFYTLDRTTGAFISARPFVKQTWAKEIGPDGRPVVLPDSHPTASGTTTCPDLFGGTNFMSPSFDASLGLFFVTARETCMVYASRSEEFKPGARWMGGTIKPAGARAGAVRAIDPLTGTVKWEFAQKTPSWAGILTTASGLLFTGDNEGQILALESKTGAQRWSAQLGAAVYAAPTTFVVDGRQFVVLPAGMAITAFALPATTATQ